MSHEYDREFSVRAVSHVDAVCVLNQAPPATSDGYFSSLVHSLKTASACLLRVMIRSYAPLGSQVQYMSRPLEYVSLHKKILSLTVMLDFEPFRHMFMFSSVSFLRKQEILIVERKKELAESDVVMPPPSRISPSPCIHPVRQGSACELLRLVV